MLSIAELEDVVTEARALSFEHDGEPAWEKEPVTEAELTAAAEHLGMTFPEGLANLFCVAGTGLVINHYLTLLPLTPNDEFPESLFVHRSKAHREAFGPNDVLWDQAGIHPSDKVLELTSYGQFGYLYETKGEHAGKILYFDVLRVPVVREKAPSLEENCSTCATAYASKCGWRIPKLTNWQIATESRLGANGVGATHAA